ncbi:hypothetical protein V7O66_08960 [Methanolobus sp. ZRKC3]|uniref:hypothetical protein n=1 Tax=Methanolobus sp. ZRKC3 TaxID=3125786 RepID=UPI00324DD0AF
MRYTYQDSTNLPLQRDFIQDLNDFIDIARNVLPLENSAIELHDEESGEVTSLEARIVNLDKFSKDVQNYVDEITRNAEDKEILECRNSVIDTCIMNSEKGLKLLNQKLEQTKQESESDLYKIENDILTTLNPLFRTGIYSTAKKYYVSMKDEVLKGTLKASFSGIEYSSDLRYSHDVLTIKEVYGDLFLPTWTKAGILHKENKVKMLDVSEFVITTINYDGDSHIDTSFENRKKDQKFRITYDGNSSQIFFKEQDITADETLLKSVKMESIDALMTELRKYVQMFIKSQTLTQILLDGKDAVRNNEIFDCLKLIAEQYGEIITESLERGYVKNEITIKIEASDGTRTEKYITKQEAFDQLAELGSEGLELASILGID